MKDEPKPGIVIHAVRAGIIALAVLTVLGTVFVLRHYPRTEDAEVRANVAGVAPQVGGSIVKLHVRDNQRVKRGDLLFELDQRPYEAEAARAKARLELVKLEVLALGDEIAVAEAALEDRIARAEYSAAHFERLKPLLKGNFTSADRVQQAEAEAVSATARIREAEAAVASARNKLGAFEGRNTRVEEAAAALRDAELKVSYCKVYAPCDGFVTNLQLAPGTYAPAGGQVFSIVDSSVWFVLANFRETDLARIQPGQKARVFLMSQRGEPIEGVVQGISRAVYPLGTASRAAPAGEGVLQRVEPTFDFVQLAQRFPVRIIIDAGDAAAFRMGGKAAVIVDTMSAPDHDLLRRLQEREGEAFTPPAENE